MSSIRSICLTEPIGGDKPARFCVGGCSSARSAQYECDRIGRNALMIGKR